MTFVELQNEILAHRLNDTKYRPPVKNWINEGQQYIFTAADMRIGLTYSTIDLSPSTISYPLPTDFLRTDVVEISTATGYQVIERMELRDFDEAYVDGVTGTPTGYVISGESISFNPTPDGVGGTPAYLSYYRSPPELTVDSDEPMLPVQWHHLLVRYALIRAFEREDDLDKANYYREAFDTELMKLKSQAQHDTYDGATQVPGEFELGPVIRANQWYG